MNVKEILSPPVPHYLGTLFYCLNLEAHVQLMRSSVSSYTYVISHPLVSAGF